MSSIAIARSTPREKVLIVGADGMLGRRLVTAFERRGADVWASTRSRAELVGQRVYLDLAGTLDHFELPFSGAGTAIICAAQTSIEQCQREPRLTRHINVDNTVGVAEQLTAAGIFVVFLSSNTVFDGSKAFPHPRDPPSPQQEYGRQKADAEAQLLALSKPVAVIRFSKIIAPDMPLLRGWMKNLAAGEAIQPFSDAVMAPLAANFATDVICHVAATKRAGVTQASAREDITYADAAKYLAMKSAAEMNLINPILATSADSAPFPKHTTLDSSELDGLGFKAPPATGALDQFLELTPEFT